MKISADFHFEKEIKKLDGMKSIDASRICKGFLIAKCQDPERSRFIFLSKDRAGYLRSYKTSGQP
jgi:hypothetical protein